MVAQLFDLLLPRERRNVIVFTGSMQSLIHQNLMFSFSAYAQGYTAFEKLYYYLAESKSVPKVVTTMLRSCSKAT